MNSCNLYYRTSGTKTQRTSPLAPLLQKRGIGVTGNGLFDRFTQNVYHPSRWVSLGSIRSNLKTSLSERYTKRDWPSLSTLIVQSSKLLGLQSIAISSVLMNSYLQVVPSPV